MILQLIFFFLRTLSVSPANGNSVFAGLMRRLCEAGVLEITREFRVIHFLPEYDANSGTTRVLLERASARNKCEFSIIARATQHAIERERSESQSRALCAK